MLFHVILVATGILRRVEHPNEDSTQNHHIPRRGFSNECPFFLGQSVCGFGQAPRGKPNDGFYCSCFLL